ncbi:MAG: phospholipid carrier-dependent glycosyltransferase [bacterium]|nr:phospholipid carrier-dependent glycosyltransferase [bacterium]
MQKTNIIAYAILFLMFILMVASAWNESAIMDELPHIPAGYSYVRYQDYRLNPEHPPLIKDLAALPLSLMQPNFPRDTEFWRDDVNGQWDQGRVFLYESGNNADRIIFLARLPVMLLAIFFGWLFFSFLRKHYEDKTALLALSLFAFSPTFLAHSRYVTTDLAAAFGFFIGLASFIMFLEEPSWKRAGIAGLALGIAQLLKFSLFLLFPIYGIVLLVWLLAHIRAGGIFRFPVFAGMHLIKLAAIFVIAVALIWPVYQFHVWNYPPERQKSDTVFILGSFAGGPDPKWETCNPKASVPLSRRVRCVAEFTTWASDKPWFRPYAQYLLGLTMVLQRSSGGNTAYFLGEVSAAGWTYYFPTLYLLKEPLPLHVLTLIALLLSLWALWRARWGIGALASWIREHPLEFTSLFFIAFYWLYSIRSPLNIGVRHVLPTFPFIYLLVAKTVYEWVTFKSFGDPVNWFSWLKNVFSIYIKSLPKYLFLYAMVLWLFFGALLAFPYYLSFYNELAGGTRNGYTVAVDSNYDWGQDLIRLKQYVEENNIQKISLDYFGGGNPEYYLGNKFVPWQSTKGKPSGYFAVSATFQQERFATPAAGFVRAHDDSYEWLKPFRPVARAGTSIFIYKLP